MEIEEQSQQAERLYNRSQLQEALQRVQQLSPNYPQPDSLHARDLDVQTVEAVVTAILESNLFQRYIDKERNLDFEVELEDVGTLTLIGTGESKYVFRLETLAGKKIAVSIMQQDTSKTNISIPQDPRLVVHREFVTENVNMFYSDLRYYLLLPISFQGKDHFRIGFQEYARDRPIKALLAPLTFAMKKLGVMIYLNRYRRSKGFKSFEGPREINLPRHRLFAGENLVFIDLPVTFKS